MYVIDMDTDSGPAFDSFSYPAGELQVRLKLEAVPAFSDILVVARLQHAQDFMRLALFSDALYRNHYQNRTHLYLPYLPYARADRCFVPGDCHGLATFLKLLGTSYFDRVSTLDVHNPKAVHSLAPYIYNLSPVPYVLKAAVQFALATHSTDINILYPDEGAKHRFELPDSIDCHGIRSIRLNKVSASKQRDAATGKLSGFKVEPVDLPTLIVDDICDGGGTFVGIAEALNTDVPLALYVTHGIFSKGFKELSKWFQAVYCTDSYPLVLRHEAPAFLKQFDAMEVLQKSLDS